MVKLLYSNEWKEIELTESISYKNQKVKTIQFLKPISHFTGFDFLLYNIEGNVFDSFHMTLSHRESKTLMNIIFPEEKLRFIFHCLKLRLNF